MKTLDTRIDEQKIDDHFKGKNIRWNNHFEIINCRQRDQSWKIEK